MRKSKWTEKANVYLRTETGFLRRRWWNLKRRCLGTSGRVGRAKGLSYCTVNEFLGWAYSEHYLKLYRAWIASGRDRRLTPTVDRIDVQKGYVIGNMQWLTLGMNSFKGCFETPARGASKYRGTYFAPGKPAKNPTPGKPRRSWRATMMIGGKVTHLGSYLTEEEAARAYDRHAKAHYGVAINFPE